MSPGTAKVYVNDGIGLFTELAGAVPQGTSSIGTGPIDLDLADVDGDFDLDLLLASRSGDSLLFVNDGTGVFADANDRLPGQPGPYVYGPDACDVDGDGDLDLWLDNGAASLREQLLINDGTGTFTDETTARVTANPGADDNEVQCADVDGDGDLDAVIASLSNEERVLENDGVGNFTLLAAAFTPAGDSTLGLDLGDLDGDGRLDAITAQGEQTPYLNRMYRGTIEQPVDVLAPTFRAVQQIADGTTGLIRVRFAVVDASTTDVGPRLREASIDLGGTTVAARFVGGDLFQASLGQFPAGAVVSYSACATDWAGNSACSATHSFTVGGGEADAGTPGGADAAVPPGADGGMTPPDEDGCSCRAGRRGTAPVELLFVLVFALLIRHRERS
jgi:MYXO-CTERM domain-containing protein